MAAFGRTTGEGRIWRQQLEARLLDLGWLIFDEMADFDFDPF
jgi:hypothetical protein